MICSDLPHDLALLQIAQVCIDHIQGAKLLKPPHTLTEFSPQRLHIDNICSGKHSK
jgi:hypothetical protein